ncbi:hypothetical protein TKK_0019002 [Trichogramma kaykai]
MNFHPNSGNDSFTSNDLIDLTYSRPLRYYDNEQQFQQQQQTQYRQQQQTQYQQQQNIIDFQQQYQQPQQQQQSTDHQQQQQQQQEQHQNQQQQQQQQKQKRYSNYVYQILKKTGEGEFLIEAYDFEITNEETVALMKCPPFSISKVSTILVWNEKFITRSCVISPDRFEELAESAHQLFPTIPKDCFYSKRSSDCNPSGSLHSSYESIKAKHNALIVTPRPSKKRKATSDVTKEFTEEFKNLQNEVNEIDSAYINQWGTETAAKKRLEFYQNNKISTIIATLPNITQPKGYLLIQADYSKFFDKSSESKLYEKWPSLSEKILKQAKKKASRCADCKSYLDDNKDCITSEQKSNLAFFLLPLLFKKTLKTSVRSSAKTNWYPTKLEVLNSFIFHLKDTSNLNFFIHDQNCIKQLYSDHKKILGTYIIVSGTKISDITTSSVIFNENIYEFDSVLQAVDICFKFNKVLHENFSCISDHVWHFLEKEVYKFEKSVDKGVNDLIKLLA